MTASAHGREVVIVSAARAPVARSLVSLRKWRLELGAIAIKRRLPRFGRVPRTWAK